ncbi:MAG TPA: 7-carboxy-7-deazaguanine synthase [Candidatus Sumerlaeota bacterium]|nr:7-carboxy-7-deazaguanine synthase [Candidatus Sumerlaeota bacterium]HNM46550.1 7-carboxy-7-deazaguanine synthase [Candidatus Sumerlaeota bacterium]
MSYGIKEVYHTLQGEGAQAGRAAVFLRFAGCNLWTGREAQRADAVCRFCDTDFVGTDGENGGVYTTAAKVAHIVAEVWKRNAEGGVPLVVCTGGEPLLQLDEELTSALKRRGFEIAVETNGTQPRPAGIDWLCVSPKIGAALELRSGDELKLVYPQEGGDPAQFESLDFTHFFLQPLDDEHAEENTRKAIAYTLAHPRWRLSIQLHKFLGLR